MKNINIIYICFVILGLSSCIKDPKSNTATYLLNNSNVSIEIIPYKDGLVDLNERKRIEPYEKIKVVEDSPFGKTIKPNWGINLQPYDSVIIVFDTVYRVKHNRFNDSLICEKCISFTNNRNITNSDNYSEFIEHEFKNSMIGYYEYIFTEEDYKFAKEP